MISDDTPRTPLLTIRRDEDAKGRVVWVRGELDVASAPELEQELIGAPLPEAGRVLLDLSELTFMDSSGLAVLVSAQEQLDGRGRRLTLRHPTMQVQRLFSIAAMLDRLDFED